MPPRVDARYRRAEQYAREKLNMREGGAVRMRKSADGYAAGKAAGATIRLTKAKAGLGSGQ